MCYLAFSRKVTINHQLREHLCGSKRCRTGALFCDCTFNISRYMSGSTRRSLLVGVWETPQEQGNDDLPVIAPSYFQLLLFGSLNGSANTRKLV